MGKEIPFRPSSDRLSIYTRQAVASSTADMAVPTGRMFKVWFHPEVIPLYAALGAGVTLGTVFGLRHLFMCPDVYVGKKRRLSTDVEKNDKNSGENWANHYIHNLTRGTMNPLLHAGCNWK